MFDKRTTQRAPGGRAWRTLHATARIGRPTARSTLAPGSSSRMQGQHDTRANGWRCDVREAGDRCGLPLGPDPGWGSSTAAEGSDGNQTPVGGAGDEQPARGRKHWIKPGAGTSRADSRPPLGRSGSCAKPESHLDMSLPGSETTSAPEVRADHSRTTPIGLVSARK